MDRNKDVATEKKCDWTKKDCEVTVTQKKFQKSIESSWACANVRGIYTHTVLADR